MTAIRFFAKAFAALSVAAGALLGGPAQAHEFWIAPLDYTVDVGGMIEARLFNGSDFKGTAYPYIDNWFEAFEIVTRKGAEPVKGRNGDNPAVSQPAETGGLHVLAYDGTMNKLTYDSWEKFLEFVTSKKLDWVLEEHDKRGFPHEKVRESYYRYPKALVKVGSGAGRDSQTGLLFEFVAETNPYSEAAKDGVRVRLFYDGQPYPGADVQIFHFPEGAKEAVKDHVTTDATGRALIPAFDGGEFLINATLMRDPRPEGAAWGAMWESLWATMTYELPR